MANKLLEYKNRFRLRAPICESTHDFSRKLDGSLEDIDIFISCKDGIKVFYFGRGQYEVYVPSLIKGHNILKDNYIKQIYFSEEYAALCNCLSTKSIRNSSDKNTLDYYNNKWIRFYPNKYKITVDDNVT